MREKMRPSTASALSVAVLTLLTSATTATLAFADDPATSPWSFSLSERLRYEYAGWNAPTGNAKERDYTFGHSKLQFGAKWKNETTQVAALGQYFQLFDVPDNAAGPGGNYASLNGEDDYPGEVVLRQLFVEHSAGVYDVPLQGKLGRFYYANGAEFVHSDKVLENLKQSRIANRVIGTFDFTAGRSFDGVQLRSSGQRELRRKTSSLAMVTS